MDGRRCQQASAAAFIALSHQKHPRAHIEEISIMLARLSIRTKITVVVASLLIVMSVVGALTVRQMYAINSSTVDIVSNWLPSVRVLGDLRAATITYRAIVRSHLLASDEAGKQAQEDLLVKWTDLLDKARKSYEPMITTAEERAVYDEFSTNWAEYFTDAKQVVVFGKKSCSNKQQKRHREFSQAPDAVCFAAGSAGPGTGDGRPFRGAGGHIGDAGELCRDR